jgi:murein DD-endopeptidase MepM/ murein hydrolase activator NlpD
VSRISGMRHVRRSLNRRAIVSTAIAVLIGACATPPPPPYSRSPASTYRVESPRPDPRESHYRAAGQIRTTFHDAATGAGMPGDMIEEVVGIFSHAVDFHRDVQAGDTFDVIFRYREAAERLSRDMDLLAASVTLSGRTQTRYRFETGGNTEYFDADGRSAIGTPMLTPVVGASVTSPFGRRGRRMHEGIDMKVPSGTPVIAASGGDVTFTGRSRGYGNLIVIEHGGGYSTAYAHLSGFASDVREGVRVNRGDVIAYSGATGNATAPHLHFEVRMNGSPVDPAKVQVRFGRKLAGRERSAFLAERARIDRLIAMLPIQARVADAR